MRATNAQASCSAKGMARKLRRARNLVRRYEKGNAKLHRFGDERYARAMTLLVKQVLEKS